jgi:hypothetical protein
MKKIISLLICISVFAGHAQQFSKPITFEKITQARIFSDKDGFIYVTGYDANQEGGTSYSDTGTTVFKIRKYDPSSAQVIWETQLNSPWRLSVADVHMRNSSLILAGSYAGTLLVDGQIKLTSNNQSNDIFIAWVTAGGSIGFETSGDVNDENLCGFEFDNSGNYYFTGHAKGQVMLGDLIYSTNPGETDFFLMKRAPGGGFLFTKIGKPAPGEYASPGGDLQCLNNRLYLTTPGRTIFGADTFGCGSNQCATTEEFDTDGNYARNVPGMGSFLYNAQGIFDVDEQDNIYCYYDSWDRYSKPEYYLSKAPQQLNPALWGIDCFATFLDPQGFKRIYDKFYFAGQDPFTFIIAEGETTTGKINRKFRIPMPDGGIYYCSIQGYKDDKLLLCGQYSGKVKFGPYEINNTQTDYIVKFVVVVDKGGFTGVKEQNCLLNDKSIYPNPSDGNIQVSGLTSGLHIYSLRDALGKIICNGTKECLGDMMNFNFSGTSEGIYFLELENKEERVVSKVIISK